MKKKYLIILILAIIALGNAVYLSSKAYQLLNPIEGINTSSGCDINATFSCTNVIVHPDTMIFGIPFPYLALIVYPIIIFLTLWGLKIGTNKPARIINWEPSGASSLMAISSLKKSSISTPTVSSVSSVQLS